MANLKDLRNRITSVKSTRKITSAMKMVAAAKLRRAQEQAEAARPYAERMERMLGELAAGANNSPAAPKLLSGTGKDETRLFIVATADRGLCGAFNSSIVREARRLILAAQAANQQVKIICIGRKARDQLRRQFGDAILETIEDIAKPRLQYGAADRIARHVLTAFEEGEFDSCVIVYNRFQSAMAQIVTAQQLIPFAAPESANDNASETADRLGGAVYDFEPDEEQILAQLLPRNLGVQIYRALLENQASEHGARMTAMDNATRNAGDMIDDLSMQYNRSRQAAITKELLEIISGAEAL